MKKFSPKLFAIGVVLGALGAVAVLATSAYARSPQKKTPTESGKPVLDWNQELIAIVNTPGAQRFKDRGVATVRQRIRRSDDRWTP